MWALLTSAALGATFMQCTQQGATTKTIPVEQALFKTLRPYVGKWKTVEVKIKEPVLENPDERRLLENMVAGAKEHLDLEIFRDYSYRAQFFRKKEIGNYQVYGDGRFLRLQTLNYEEPELELELDSTFDALSLRLPSIPMTIGADIYDMVLECRMERDF